MMRVWLMGLGALAGLFGAAGVSLAAAGAHLSGNPIVTTAAYFFLFHAGALIGLCALAARRMSALLLAAASLIAVGTILFSGDLALRGLAGITPIRLAAPIGGVVLIAGWLLTMVGLPVALARDVKPREHS